SQVRFPLPIQGNANQIILMNSIIMKGMFTFVTGLHFACNFLHHLYGIAYFLATNCNTIIH
ncbi:hypothetical protein L9F63_026329, partial [Diploptera punctata]